MKALKVVIFCALISLNLAAIRRNEKIPRLCFWTSCRNESATKKCPNNLEIRATRKCKLKNSDEIGRYQKCCIYDTKY